MTQVSLAGGRIEQDEVIDTWEIDVMSVTSSSVKNETSARYAMVGVSLSTFRVRGDATLKNERRA